MTFVYSQVRYTREREREEVEQRQRHMCTGDLRNTTLVKKMELGYSVGWTWVTERWANPPFLNLLVCVVGSLSIVRSRRGRVDLSDADLVQVVLL